MSHAPMTVDELVDELGQRNLIRVSADTGIHPNSLHRYKARKVKPSYDNLMKLTTYLRQTEAP